MSLDPAQLPIEARVLCKLDEPLASGLYELRNASMCRRWGRALKRYAQSISSLPGPTAALYPSGPLDLWNLAGAAVGYHYSFTLALDSSALERKIAGLLCDDREQQVARRTLGDLQVMGGNLLAVRYSVGGRGYTHSILDYQRLLTDGLPAYGRRIERGLREAKDDAARDFYLATGEAFEAVMILLRHAATACASGPLHEALTAVAQRPPATFHEAMVLLNFMYYIDGCDSIGALDRYLTPFEIGDPGEAQALLAAFCANVEANSGWHVILGGEGASEELTMLCLRAQNTRRPNTGLKITAETSDEVWAAAFDCLQGGSGNPSFYNDAAYRKGAVELAGVNADDLPRIAYGGCTEFMVEGRANVGSIDAGLNLLRVLDGTIRSTLAEADSFDAFRAVFEADIRRQIEMMVAELELNQRYKATCRPQLIRTLFIADCLDRAVEYNQGGARYNGGVINVVGIANAANALFAIRAAFEGFPGMDRAELLAALNDDFEGHGSLHQQLLALPKFGNRQPDVDQLAQDIVGFTFGEISRHRCWRGNGFLIPSTILFTTYAGEGRDVDATPDGRRAGTPIADSCGPMQGTDRDGPTSMLTSTARLPQSQGLGTMILNLRVSARLLASPGGRRNLRGLLMSYVEMGGMQVQVTALDAEVLADAMEHPEMHENLIVRIGGFTEYFNRLSTDLKHEVLDRTEHL